MGGIHVGLESPRTAAKGMSWRHWGNEGGSQGPDSVTRPRRVSSPLGWSAPEGTFPWVSAGKYPKFGVGGVGSRGCTRSLRTPRFLASHASGPLSPQEKVGACAELASSPGPLASCLSHPTCGLELGWTPSRSCLPGFGVSWTSRAGWRGVGTLRAVSRGPGPVMPWIQVSSAPGSG